MMAPWVVLAWVKVVVPSLWVWQDAPASSRIDMLLLRRASLDLCHHQVDRQAGRFQLLLPLFLPATDHIPSLAMASLVVEFSAAAESGYESAFASPWP